MKCISANEASENRREGFYNMNGNIFLLVFPINALGQFALDSSAEGNCGECITMGNIFFHPLFINLLFIPELYFFIFFIS